VPGGVAQLEELGDEFDVDQSATRQLDVPNPIAPLLLLDRPAHLENIGGKFFGVPGPAENRADRRLRRPNQPWIAGN
jgi:hypothetical protein